MVTNLVFWLFNILLMVLDVTGWPAILKCYKIQPDKNNPVQYYQHFIFYFFWVCVCVWWEDFCPLLFAVLINRTKNPIFNPNLKSNPIPEFKIQGSQMDISLVII